MACSVTKGRKLSCKDQRGGIKYIDFAVFKEYGFSVTAQEIAALPVLLTEVFRYEVKATVNNLAEAGTVNQDNRTTEVVATLSVTLPKLDASYGYTNTDKANVGFESDESTATLKLSYNLFNGFKDFK